VYMYCELAAVLGRSGDVIMYCYISMNRLLSCKTRRHLTDTKDLDAFFSAVGCE
jgi:hypothetical protein